MLRKIIIGALLLSLALIIVGCSDPTSNPTPSGPIKATLIEPQDGNMTFMAYTVGGEIYVRANICPPCHSTGFSLKEGVLICDRCATTFDAKTGAGVKGACVAYPKAAVAYEISDGNIVMKSVDLITAYQDTIEPG